MTGETRGYVTGPWGQMHYRRRGSGAPLLLLHQTPWTSIQYSKAAPLLAASRQTIALDTPGYGLSDGPPEPPTIPDYADVIPAFLDALGLEQVDVLGHHTGALIAGAFAVRHPQRVNRLVLHGAPLYDPDERAQRLAQPHFDQTPKPDGSHFVDYWTRVQRVIGEHASPHGLHQSVLNFFSNGSTEWYGHGAAFNYDFAADAPSLKGPALVLSNSGDIISHHAERMKAMQPSFTYIELEGGSSNIVFDEPERWSDAVAGWLDRS